MDAIEYIVWPGRTLEPALAGGKAAALAAVSVSKLADMVPPWFALTKEAFLLSRSQAGLSDRATEIPPPAPAVLTALDEALRTLAGTDQADGEALYAVRSSAVGEDGGTASYAGQLHSELNVPAAAVPEAVRRVWASAFGDNVAAYRALGGQEETSLLPAVLVQRMVVPRAAGVGFSAGPVTGDPKRMVVNACAGLGDKLVSGQVDGDTYICDRQGRVLERLCDDPPVLRDEEISRICALLRDLEELFQHPQDVEWAVADDRLYLLQSRPITTLKPDALPQTAPWASTAGARHILWDNSNIVESYSGVTSPLTFSFARYVYEHVYTQFCRIMGVSEKRLAASRDVFRNMLGSINGHVYYNLLNWYRMLTLFPGFSLNRGFMEQMMGVGESLPPELLDTLRPARTGRTAKALDGLALIRSGLGLVWHALTLGRTVQAFRSRLDDALSTPISALDAMPLDELAGEYRRLERQLLRAWDAPLINDFLCMAAFGVSRKLLAAYGGEAGLAYHRDMLIGQGGIISAEPARRIRAMAEMAAPWPDLAATLAEGDPQRCRAALQQPGRQDLRTAMDAYLDLFGDRCLQELKLESPTMADDPSTLFTAVGHLALRLQQGDAPAPQAAPARPLADIIGPGLFRNALTGFWTERAKNLVRGRENLRFERTRVFGRVRRLFRNMGQRLQALGLLDEAHDVFYLETEEVLGLIEGTATMADVQSTTRLRREEYSRLTTLPEPPGRLITDGAVLGGLAWFPAGSVIRTTLPEADADQLIGLGCCRGQVTASVRVIDDPRGATLKNGEILAARFTDPGWITLFANAAGILVERGSLLSHSAIVAREMNIPAIVGIKGLTRRLRTGDVVAMDGATGVARKLS